MALLGQGSEYCPAFGAVCSPRRVPSGDEASMVVGSKLGALEKELRLKPDKEVSGISADFALYSKGLSEDWCTLSQLQRGAEAGLNQSRGECLQIYT